MNRIDCHGFFGEVLAGRLADCLSVAMDCGGEIVYEYCGTNGVKPEYAEFSRNTRFNIGSVTKIITAALVVKLIERGRLSAYEKVRSHIPDFPFGDVEVQHLLMHTSGCACSAPWAEAKESGERAYLEKIYAGIRRVEPPGTAMSYWTAGYSILMDLIQRTTGMSLECYAAQELFAPLGMTQTTFDIANVPERDRSFILDAGTDRLLPEWHTPPTGDTGLYSTPRDLLKFSREVLDINLRRKIGIYSVYATDLMFRELTSGRFDRTLVFWKKSNSRLFGRCFGDLNSEHAVFHTGYTGCILLLDPEYDLCMALLTNSPGLHACDENYSRIINRLMGSLGARSHP